MVATNAPGSEAMAAGPGLDAALEERVFARELQHYPTAETAHLPKKDRRYGSGRWEGHRWVLPPRYSTTWEGAGLVVERMRALGYWLGLNVPSACGSDREACAVFWHAFPNDPDEDERFRIVGDAHGDTAPHATALAALAAVAVQP